MKYISRLTALLLALMMIITSSVAETISNTGLTRDMLDALYQSASEEGEIKAHGVIGQSITLKAFADFTLLYEDFEWHLYNKEGPVVAQGTNSYVVPYSLEDQYFVCTARVKVLNFWELTSRTFMVPAATNPEPYLQYMYTQQTAFEDHQAVYDFVMNNWNVDYTDQNGSSANLGSKIIAAWDANMIGLPEDLFCTCVAVGGLNHRDCLLPPDGGHLQSCPWFNNVIMPPLPEQPPLFDGAPDGEQYIATETVALSDTANRAVILPEGGRAVLTYSGLQAQSRGGSGNNWQIFTGDEWVDIQGDSDPSIVITEAKINSITQLTGIAQLRYLDKDNSVVLASASLTTKAIAGGEYVDDQPAPVSLVSQSRADDTTTPDMFDVVVNYVYDSIDGKSAGSSYSAQVARGEDLPGNAVANPPTIVGYDAVELVVVSDNADVANQIKTTTATKTQHDNKDVTTITSVDLSGITNVQSDISIYIIYKPGEVEFTIRHYFQNVNNDDYDETPSRDVTAYGITGTPVGGKKEIVNGVTVWEYSWYLAIDAQRGFKALPYDPSLEIAPNGSTVVEIYYDRSYYLLGIDLNGGTGAEPVYARFDAPVSVNEPTRIGYAFAGWILGKPTYAENGKLLSVTYDTTQEMVPLPPKMPAVNSYYQAQWTKDAEATLTVVYWGENADDEDYSVLDTEQITVSTDPTLTYWNQQLYTVTCDTPYHKHTPDCDGARKTCLYDYEHEHDECVLNCLHTHSNSCYPGTGSSVDDPSGSQPESPKEGQVYRYRQGSRYNYTYYIYIAGEWYNYTLQTETTYNWNGNNNTSYTTNTVTPSGCTHQTHEDTCYTCGKEGHAHTNACYDFTNCPYTEEHVHNAGCHGTTSVANLTKSQDSTLYTLVDGGEVQVQPDGSSILNVKYDRKEFTLTFHYNYNNNNNSYRNTGTITDKWGANIAQRFLDMNVIAKGNLWSTDTGGGDPWTSYLEIMPQENRDYYCRNTSTSAQSAEYYTETLTSGQYKLEYTVNAYYGSGLSISKEDFYPMEGFTYDHGTDGDRGSMSSPGSYGDFDGAKFYYNRNSYELSYMNDDRSIVATQSVLYEYPLKNVDTVTPPYPSTLTPGAYEFAYWCMDESLQQAVKWDKMTMPAADVMVYAKWVPKTFTVLYFRYDTDMNTYNKGVAAYGDAYKADPTAEYFDLDGDGVEETLNEHMLQANPDSQGTIKEPIPYGEVIPQEQREALPAPIQAEPVGWFYIGEDGKEHAFDYSTPITHDMQLYVKWTSSVLVEYVIYYRTKLDNGSVVDIAEPTMGYMLGMTSKTFPAKGGEDLYAADSEGNSTGLNFQNEYYPETNAHSLTAEVKGMSGQVTENEWFDIKDEAGVLRSVQGYVFMYVKSDGEPYKVRYLTTIPQTNSYGTVDITDEDGNVTTYYRLAEDKVFEKNTRSIVTEVYEPVTGYKPDAYQKRLVLALEGGHVPGNPDSITENVLNFFYEEDSEHAPLHIIHYVQTIGDGYEIYTQSTDLNALIKDKEGKYMTYSEDPLVIDGYTHVPKDEAPFGETVTSGTMTEKGLQLRFYYDENLVTYNYKVVGPDGDVQESGTYGQLVQLTKETERVMTGTVHGTTAEPISTTYKFVGWFKDAECKQPVVDAGWVTDNTIKPQKTVNQYYLGGNYYEGYPSGEFTYYAKFDYNAGKLKIEKQGLRPGESAIVRVETTSITGTAETFSLVMTGDSNGYAAVTISNLLAGANYTVWEDGHWTWSYDTVQIEEGSGKINGGNNPVVVTITNKPKPDKWLHDEGSVVNDFGTGEADHSNNK